MPMLISLWLPIIAASVAVFFWSFLTHAVLPFHKADWKKAPDEQAFLQALRGLHLPAGNYAFPFQRTGEAAKAPEFIEAMKTGPMGTITVWPGMPNMGINMGLTFAWNLLTTIFVAYLAAITLTKGAEFARVLQVVGTAAVLGHTFSQMPGHIWYQASRSMKIACVIDGVVSGVVTGLVFAALWPKA